MLHEESNQNLTRAQKDLLHWHWRLGHASQKRVQGLMRKNVHTDEQLIVPNVKKASSCFRLLCTACRLARTHRNSAHLPPRHPAPDMLIRANDLLPGDCASVEVNKYERKRKVSETILWGFDCGGSCKWVYSPHSSGLALRW